MAPLVYNPIVIKPQALRPGDLIAIAAPSSPIRAEYLERGVAELAALGFRCTYDDGILDRRHYLAGDDARRAKELDRYLADEQVKALIMARGGYGSARILELLHPANWTTPKIVCGYSDCTTLHLFIQKHAGWVTLYGPMAAWELARGAGSYDRESFLAAVAGRVQIFDGLLPIKPGPPVRGRLNGGCLSLLQAAIGTDLQPDLRGAIVLLEDEHEKPYRIDRMLTHLKRAGVLDGVAGIVFGQMPGCRQSENDDLDLAQTLAELTPDVPVVWMMPAGHAGRVATVPLGVEAELDAGAGRLRLLEAGVSI